MTSNGVKQRLHASTGALTKDIDGVERKLIVAIYSSTLLRKLKIGDVILVLARGDWWHHGFNSVTEIRLDLEHDWQLARLRRGQRS